MDWIVTMLLYAVPWWAQVAVMAVIVGVPTYLVACMVWGTTTANRFVVHGLLALLTLGLASKLRQEGYRRRIEEEQRAARSAEAVVAEERAKAAQMDDDALAREVDRWSRK